MVRRGQCVGWPWGPWVGSRQGYVTTRPPRTFRTGVLGFVTLVFGGLIGRPVVSYPPGHESYREISNPCVMTNRHLSVFAQVNGCVNDESNRAL
ncbi:hypothetical protein Ssi02_12040 [Sinosporangium siamense]|uniref:Uncharacterized protein n=1 Tax=Sinosporangium siamense TaxID=1367973 RepID=A0A919RBQ9_9ACTN|nr:hypothetical protein Ssi02_12040 [Sinosporangium siamense]